MSTESGSTWPDTPAGSLDPEHVTPEVHEAVREIVANFPGSTVLAWSDGEGGAFVVIDDVDVGEAWVPRISWLGCRILNAYPEADVYPLFVRGDLARSDRAPLVAPMNPSQRFAEKPAVMVSRTSPRRSASTASAAVRLINTLSFLRNQR